MHPATSVIIFTVLSGAGFGMIATLGMGLPVSGGPVHVFVILALAFALSVVGLVSSLFHLGHPERAWRALSQWRSSWLSREGVFAIMTLVLFAIHGGLWLFLGIRHSLLGLVVAVLAAITVFATSMIYAQLKTVPQWHGAGTPAAYLAFSAASGLLLAAGFSGSGSEASISALALVGAAWAIKIAWWIRAGKMRLAQSGSSPETATALGFLGKVRLFERPHTGSNYLTREMVHKIGRKHASRLRLIAIMLGAGVPGAAAIATGLGAPGWLLAAGGIVMLAGLFAERWLFFAEAEHVVSLYYGER